MRLLIIIASFCFTHLFAQETNTAIGFTLSPGFSAPRYVSSGAYTQGKVDSIKGHESGKVGLSGDFFFQYTLSHRISVDWGLGARYYGYRSSIYSELTPSVAGYSRFARYSQYYIRFQTSGKFRFYKTLYARLGVGLNLLAESREKVDVLSPTENYSYSGTDNRNFKEALWTVTFGLGYEMKMTDKINLVAEFYGSSGFTRSTDFTNTLGPIVDSKAPLDRVPMLVGITLGIIRYF
ncbi:MAG: hypothetical protein ACI837_000843 [Crocinitomicaceae bacterium]